MQEEEIAYGFDLKISSTIEIPKVMKGEGS